MPSCRIRNSTAFALGRSVRVFSLFFAVVFLFPSIGFPVDKLRVSHCYIGGAILPLWIAKEAGLYQREGLDVELISIQGNPATAALVAGEIDLLYCIPHNTISAIANGADVVFISSIYNRMQYRIVAGPDIERPQQLRGKIIGVARVHDVSHFYIRLALQRFGMNADQDIRVIAVGGQSDRVLALKSGRVAATIVNPANALVLEKSGFKTVIDLESLNFPVVGNVMAARRATVKERRPILVRFMHAFVAGLKKIQNEPEFSKKVLAKYLRLQDKAVIEENYRFNSGPYLERVPTIPLEGLRYAIESLIPTVPAAKNLKAESMIDTSILDAALREPGK
ncbi:MAG TPA: ABC transporter substrate-binding protein [Methylomirabilota bacterium]|nr:ABC transporter substrate-binding protein [Methylomirabilota bacterium]